jgi:hypothetical protein
MTLLKVLGVAALFGILFGFAGMAFLDGVEKAVGKGASVAIIFFGVAGAIIGAIAGAAQAIVDTLDVAVDTIDTSDLPGPGPSERRRSRDPAHAQHRGTAL